MTSCWSFAFDASGLRRGSGSAGRPSTRRRTSKSKSLQCATLGVNTAFGCVVRRSVGERNTSAQVPHMRLHRGDDVTHFGAACVLSVQLFIQCFDLFAQVRQRRFPLSVGQFWTHAILRLSEFFDVPHRMVDCPKLLLDLRQQIKVQDRQHFGVSFNELRLVRPVESLHTSDCKEPDSRTQAQR
jgi:hypothetical protein